MSPSVTSWDVSFVRQHSQKTPGGTCFAPKFTELLSCAFIGQCRLIWHTAPQWLAHTNQIMAGRQEKKSSPLCLVNPKCPIGLK